MPEKRNTFKTLPKVDPFHAGKGSFQRSQTDDTIFRFSGNFVNSSEQKVFQFPQDTKAQFACVVRVCI